MAEPLRRGHNPLPARGPRTSGSLWQEALTRTASVCAQVGPGEAVAALLLTPLGRCGQEGVRVSEPREGIGARSGSPGPREAVCRSGGTVLIREYLQGSRNRETKPEKPLIEPEQTPLDVRFKNKAETLNRRSVLTQQGRKRHEGPRGDEEGALCRELPQAGRRDPAAVPGGSGLWSPVPVDECPGMDGAREPGHQHKGTQDRHCWVQGPGLLTSLESPLWPHSLRRPCLRRELPSWSPAVPAPPASGRLVPEPSLLCPQPPCCLPLADHKPSLVLGGP